MRPADEFHSLAECAAEVGRDWTSPAKVERLEVLEHDGQTVSTLVWGASEPQLVLLHGGAQNAHTWDMTALALDEPLIALDLPGHGRSSWRPDGDYSVTTMAGSVAKAIAEVAPAAATIVGVGLGGSVAVAVTGLLAGQWQRLVLVDSLAGLRRPDPKPGGGATAAHVASFTAVEEFPSFEAMVDRARLYSPGRSERALRRGLEHNAVQRASGEWRWRWDPRQREGRDYAEGLLFETLRSFGGQVLIVRAGLSDVISDEAAEAVAGNPAVRLISIPGAEHGVQGTHPVALADALRTFLHPLPAVEAP